MNIRDLEYLVAWLSTAIFGGRQIPATSASRPLAGRIRKLEDELGVMLLERTSRKVLFTRAGMLLVRVRRVPCYVR